MADATDSQRILCPWFDKQEIKHLHEWMVEFLSDALGDNTTLEIRDLLDVDFDEDQDGMVLTNYPDGASGGLVQMRWPYYTVNLGAGTTNTTGQANGQHVIYNFTAGPATYSWASAPSNANPAIFTVYNSSGSTVTINPDPAVTITWPEGTTLTGDTATLSGDAQYVTFIKTGVDAYIAIGTPDGSFLTVDLDATTGQIPRWQGPNDLGYSEAQIDATGNLYYVKRPTVLNTASATMVHSEGNSNHTYIVDRATDTTVQLEGTTASGTTIRYVQKGAGRIVFTGVNGATIVNRQSHTKSAAAGAVVQLDVYNSGGANAIGYLSGDTAA